MLRRTAASQSVGKPLQSAGSNSTKGEQNSNSLAGASFPTFCALMSAIAGIVYSSGKNTYQTTLFTTSTQALLANIDPKIRVRAIKKGVTLGDLSHYYTTTPQGNSLRTATIFLELRNGYFVICLLNLLEREVADSRLENMWRALLENKDHREAQRMLQEALISTSGLLLRSTYRRYSPLIPASGTPHSTAIDSGCWSPQLVRTFTDGDLDAIRAVWERNSDQVHNTECLF